MKKINLFPGNYRLAPVACAVIATLAAGVQPVCASDWFNPALLGGGAGKSHAGGASSAGLDEDTLQRLANGQQPPGTYVLDVYVNNRATGRRNVILTEDGPDHTLTPVLSVNEVLAMGVKSETLSESGKIDMVPENGDTPLKGILNHVPGTQVHFDFSRQRLNIQIPELIMVKEMSGATDPRFWDDGITALVSGYNFSAWHSQGQDNTDTDTDSAFLSLNNSLNLGAWRLHNFSTWTRSETSGDRAENHVTEEWESVNTWADRPIPQLKGMLSAGDYYTPSDVFDSVQFRGGQLASDEEMNPDYLNDFAPVVRGTAAGNAQVIIRQNGNIVYQTTVAPGPFTITDIPSSSLNGDFLVTVREADGTERSFIQGNSSVAVMQREGQLRYAFTGGKLRDTGTGSLEPEFMQGTLIYGLPHDLTVYGGLLGSQEYQAGNIGMGALLGVAGALSVDVTQAKTDRAGITGEETDGTDKGQAWRLRYAKSLAETGSTLSVSASHYSGDYWNFSDAYALDSENHNSTIITDDGILSVPVINDRARDDVQVSLTQYLGEDFGSLGLNASRKTFQDLEGEQTSVSLNWNVNVRGIGLGVGYQVSKWPDNEQDDERLVSLMVTLPLQQWLGTKHALYSASTYTHNDSGRQTLNNTVGGSLLEGNNLSWNVGQSSIRPGDEGGDNSNNGNMNLSYSGGQGRISGGYSYSPDNKQYDLGLQGGVMLTRYGLTLSQTPGETMALVRAPGADDVTVRYGTGITTDRFGNAVVPAQPYQRNKIDLDLLSAGENVSLSDTSRVVIPSRGAVVLAYYDTAIGYQMLMTLTRQGKPLPFGTMVSLVQKEEKDVEGGRATGGNGIVGDAGQVWMAGMPEEGTLNVVWGEGSAGTCTVRYQLNEAAIRAAEERRLPVETKGECS
ncbi:fimbria/pilus outer membrane usher protein [Enterobacter mori]|uniref:fimbria/pilus outer membrane usher protein n=1 Tax=Enterobacter mori TaxID=539813 RepID=UPI003B844AF3